MAQFGQEAHRFHRKAFSPFKRNGFGHSFFYVCLLGFVQVKAGRYGGRLPGKRYKYIPVRCASAIPWLQSFPGRRPPYLPALPQTSVASRMIETDAVEFLEFLKIRPCARFAGGDQVVVVVAQIRQA